MRKVTVIPMRFEIGFGRSQMAFYDILIPKGALTCVIPIFQCFFLWDSRPFSMWRYFRYDFRGRDGVINQEMLVGASISLVYDSTVLK